MKILHAFQVHGLGAPTRLEVRVAQQIETAMQNNYKWISGLEVSGNPLLCVGQIPILR